MKGSKRTGGARRVGWPVWKTYAHADAALGLWVVSLVAMMIVPLPTLLLDLLIASNLALSVLLLLVSLTVRDGLAFTSMPTLLLVTTLFRLALNVSSTRLILLQADAGQIIRAFGDFVVRGDYAVGGAVFLLLTVVQYVVVARGSERVAEVGARFSLDALPGKQLAIDADVRLGAMTVAAARSRRAELERESRFYGAMDGAMKFVKGDAIAGIVIAIVSFVAGSSLGALRDGLSLSESLRVYGLLTIGDALVSQVPSLMVAISAGLVVTRVASGEEHASLGSDLARQLLGSSRVLWTTAAFFAALACVPGLPTLPFAALALVLGLCARTRVGEEARALQASEHGREPASLRIELGAQAARQLLDSPALLSAVQAVRARVSEALGLPLSAIDTLERRDLPARGYVIHVASAPVEAGTLPAGDDALALDALVPRLERALQRHAASLLGVDEAHALVEAVAKHSPVLVQQLVPQTLSLRALTQVLQRLLAEGVSLRPLRPVLEALAVETTGSALAPLELVERVRVRLGHQITAAHTTDGTLRTHAIDPMIEDALRDAVVGSGESAYLALRPDLASDIVASVRHAIGDIATLRAVLITQPDVRRWLRALIEVELPELAVLSYSELPPNAQVEPRAPVRVRVAA